MRAILTYHSVDPSGSAISIGEAQLAAHVQWLASGAVRVVPLEAITTDTVSGDAVALTFDDGFANFGDLAWPLLRAHGLPATVFVVSGRVGASNAWDGAPAHDIPTLPLMGWDVLARVAAEGATLGAHTVTHPDLRTVAAAQLSDEMESSARVIGERTGARPRTFAYPYGAAGAREARAARTTYRLAVTTELRWLGGGEDPMLVPRLDAYYFRDAGRLEAWGTPGFRRRIKLRGLLRRGRAALRRVGAS